MKVGSYFEFSLPVMKRFLFFNYYKKKKAKPLFSDPRDVGVLSTLLNYFLRDTFYHKLVLFSYLLSGIQISSLLSLVSLWLVDSFLVAVWKSLNYKKVNTYIITFIFVFFNLNTIKSIPNLQAANVILFIV